MTSDNSSMNTHRYLVVCVAAFSFFGAYVFTSAYSPYIPNMTNQRAAVIDTSGTQLISAKTFVKDSGNFTAPQFSDRLWDGCTVGTTNCVTRAPDTASFFVEFDFGAIYDLQSARLFGDVDGNGISENWSLEYKKEFSATWATAFTAQEAFGNGWFDKALTNVSARYVRITVNSNRVTVSATEARELEIYGTLASAPTPVPTSATTTTVTTPVVVPPTPTATTGATYFVSPQGNNSNAGTFVEPWKTVQKAADSARAGDTVLIRGGTYTDGFTLRTSGNKDAPITFRNFQDEHPLFDLGVTNAFSAPKRIELQAAAGIAFPISWIVIEGLEITNAYEGFRFYNATDVIIRHNSIHDTFYSGIEGIGGLRVTIDGNKINAIGLKDLANKSNDDNDHGMHLTGSDYVITNNIVNDVRSYGIHLAGYQFSSSKYADREHSGIRNARVANNVIANSRFHTGVALWEDAANTKIENNIFYQNARELSTGAQAGVDLLFSGAGHTIRNNIFYHPSKLDFSPGGSGLSISENNSNADPKFVNASIGNFHLQTTSPAIDTGVTVPGVSVDSDGNSRPHGCCFDVGAYEYTAISVAPVSTVPPPVVVPLAPHPLATPPLPPPNELPASSVGSYVKVAPPYAIRVRALPSLQGAILGREKPDAAGVVTTAPVQADRHSWYKVKFQSDMIEGWASDQYLVYLSPPSNIFAINSTVETTQKVNIRSTAGGLKVGVQTQGSIGSILAGPTYRPFGGTQWWWKIDYATGADGWTSADFLSTRPVLSGYSSKIIHVRFREDTVVSTPATLLPIELRNAVASISKLFSLSDKQINELGNTKLNLWFEITLKDTTDTTVFIENLKHLSTVEVAEFAPLPSPPPE